MFGSGGPLIQPEHGSVKSQEARRKHWEPRWEKKLHSVLSLQQKISTDKPRVISPISPADQLAFLHAGSAAGGVEDVVLG